MGATVPAADAEERSARGLLEGGTEQEWMEHDGTRLGECSLQFVADQVEQRASTFCRLLRFVREKLAQKPVDIARRGRRNRHVHPLAGTCAVAARPARIQLRTVRQDLVDAERPSRDRQDTRLRVAHADGTGRYVVQPASDRRALLQTGLRGSLCGDISCYGRGRYDLR